MLLEVRDFLSIRHARLETDLNHAIIAGRNGCGKSQFLAAFAEESLGPGSIMDDYGAYVTQCPVEGKAPWAGFAIDDSGDPPTPATVLWAPPPDHVCYLPPQRVFGKLRSQLSYGLWHAMARHIGEDVSWYYAADIAEAWARVSSKDETRIRLQAAIVRLTGKLPLSFHADDPSLWTVQAPGATGRQIPFTALSSGEKHATVLLMLVAASYGKTLFLIDELERHLHPSLQAGLMGELLSMLPTETFLLVTTHSPSLVLAASMTSSWWMDDAAMANGQNQLRQIAGSLSRTTRIFALYVGCSVPDAVPEVLVLAQEEAFGAFLDQCYELPGVEPYEAAKDSDPQVAEIRTSVAAEMRRHDGPFHFVDFGCGQGRCLRAFEGFPSEQRERLSLHLVDRDPTRLAEAITHVPAGDHFAGVDTHCDIGEVEAAQYIAAANVFHEVVGEQFVEAFGAIWNRLSGGGTLHILEMGELLVGEKGFLTICRDGYTAFFSALANAASFTFSHFSHSDIGLIAAQATRTDAVTVPAEAIRAAYVAALKVTKSHCLAKLAGDTCSSRRAFWLENLASVDRTLEEMAGDGRKG